MLWTTESIIEKIEKSRYNKSKSVDKEIFDEIKSILIEYFRIIKLIDDKENQTRTGRTQ